MCKKNAGPHPFMTYNICLKFGYDTPYTLRLMTPDRQNCSNMC